MLTLCATRNKAPGHLADRRPPAAGASELRQLRHHTKNALQRILAQVLEAPGLLDNARSQCLARDIERRIKLSAAISDALFGLTRAPGPFAARLQTLCRSVVDLYADPAQIIRLDVTLEAACPPGNESLLLRIVHELVGNAVKHGMHMRLIGRITVRLAEDLDGWAVLSVANDGWRLDDKVSMGDGLDLVDELAAALGGTMRLRAEPITTVEVRLPLSRRPSPGEVRGFVQREAV